MKNKASLQPHDPQNPVLEILAAWSGTCWVASELACGAPAGAFHPFPQLAMGWLFQSSRHLLMKFQRQHIEVLLLRKRDTPAWLNGVYDYRLVFQRTRWLKKPQKFAEIDLTDVEHVRRLFQDVERYLARFTD